MRAYALAASLLLSLAIMLLPTAAASTHANDDNDAVTILTKSSFIDSEGKTRVVGTIQNRGDVPVMVTMGLEVTDENGKRILLQELSYSRIMWPSSDSPFKFVVESGAVGEPFVMSVQQVEAAYYNLLVMEYDAMAVGEERAFVGTVKNTAPFDMHNVSIFASVRNEKGVQIDSVRSNVIPVLKAGEVHGFVAVPDESVRADAFFYSCAGLDYDNPITTIDAGEGKFIAYDLAAAAQIRSLRYESDTDSIAFGIKHYGANGGPLSLKVPQLASNQTLTVIMDGEPHEASVSGDGRTMSVDFVVPGGDHEVQIQGVRNVPEFPFVMLALGGVTAGAVALARLKAAFKIS